MTNVLHVNKFYYPHVGGIESHVRSVAEGMRACGYDVSVLASVPRGRGRTERVHGVPVTRTASLGTLWSVPLSPGFPRQLYAKRRTADVVHHHLPNPLGVASDLLVGGEAKTVCTYHSDIVKQKHALTAYEPVLYRFLDQVDRIVVTSPRLLEHSEHLGPYADKCEVIPLSIDAAEYGDYDGPEYDVGSSDRPLLLFVGRLNYYKGAEYLVDAMQSVDADLLIVGDGERWDALQARTVGNGVDGKVTFLGEVSDEKLRYCYDRSDVFVLPSVEPSEAFGIVQLEAMAHGMPVVNTDLPTGVPWVSRDGETGLTVPPRDSEALASALNALLDDETLRTTLGRNARRRVEETFDVDDMMRDLDTLYSRLTA